MVETPRPRRKRIWIVVGIVVVIIVVIGAFAYLMNRPISAPAAPNGPNVTIWDGGFCNSAGNCGYSPTAKNVTAGTTITWTNTGGQSHTVTECATSDTATSCPDGAGANASTSRVFDSNSQSSSSLNTNQQYQFTFNLPKGTYFYYCTLHPWMHGSVVVLS